MTNFLRLSHHDLGDSGAVSLAAALQSNEYVETVELSDTGIGDRGAAMLAVALDGRGAGNGELGSTGAGGLRSLALWGNRIADEGVGLLAEALKRNSSVTRLGLEFNAFGVEGASLLADALLTNVLLREVGVEGNELGGDGAAEVGAACAAGRRIAALRMCRCGVDAEGPSFRPTCPAPPPGTARPSAGNDIAAH